MTTTIDHTVRRGLNISSVHYIIMDACDQCSRLFLPTGDLADMLGLSHRAVTVAINELCSSSPALLIKSANGSHYPTNEWYRAKMGEEIKVSPESEVIAEEVIRIFNDVNGSKFMVPNNSQLVKTIIKQNPKLTLDHFKSVIMHKNETWAGDTNMDQYNRPATLFRSSNTFMKYLDDATKYWVTKTVSNEYSRANRQEGNLQGEISR